MEFVNFKINRVIAHEIPSRAEGGERREPVCSDRIETFDAIARRTLGDRILEAISQTSRCRQMQVTSPPSTSFKSICSCVKGEERDFIDSSKELARLLNMVNARPSKKPEIFMVIAGTIELSNRPMIAVVKADTYAAFHKVQSEGGRIEHLQNIFLSPSATFYKVGMFIARRGKDGQFKFENPEDFEVYIFDETITSRRDGSAAAYFYSSFLGCKHHEDDRHHTAVVFRTAQDFIRSQIEDPVEVYERLNSLRSTLYSNNATFLPQDLAETILPEDLVQPFLDHLEGEGVPRHSITKDLTEVRNQARKRTMKFENGVRLYGNWEDFVDQVEIEQQDGQTVITVRSAIAEQK